MTQRLGTELETYTGRYVDLNAPRAATIALEDIAVGLSNTCRYGGQVTKFYSVAEHAVRVSYLVPPELALPALHHDSHEAYMGDIISPMKLALNGQLQDMAFRLDRAICGALGIKWTDLEHPLVKKADEAALYAEAAALKWSHGTGKHWGNSKPRTPWAGLGWSPERAERKFIERHKELTNA